MEEKAGQQKQGDGNAVLRLEAVYQRYVGLVYTLCLRLLRDVRAAEEATVQVFVRLGRELTERWEESGLRVRLRDLTITEALSRLRVRIDRTVLRNASPHIERNPGKNLPATIDQSALDSLTARLPDHLRVAFVLRDMEGLSNEVVATHLGIGEAEVRRLVHYARLEIRRLWLGQ